jgi:hypothetical protein
MVMTSSSSVGLIRRIRSIVVISLVWRAGRIALFIEAYRVDHQRIALEVTD